MAMRILRKYKLTGDCDSWEGILKDGPNSQLGRRAEDMPGLGSIETLTWFMWVGVQDPNWKKLRLCTGEKTGRAAGANHGASSGRQSLLILKWG